MSVTAPKNIARYQVLKHLASGGMGSVFLARDPAIANRLVAIKLLREGFDSLELRERFMREASAAGSLRHVNIVTIFDVGEYDDQPFIAMEYVEGQTLDALIGRRTVMSIGQKLQLIDALCAALQYAHRAGIVHRDIKPKNIMLDGDGVLKVLDFGIARISDARGLNTQGSIGTLNYMAPEQMMGLIVDARADMFAAGAVFYELLAYRQAFPGGLDAGILYKIVNATFEPLQAVDPSLDPELIAVVNRCLEKSPDSRYADMAAVRRDLVPLRRRYIVDAEDNPPTVPSDGLAPVVLDGLRTSNTALQEPPDLGGATVPGPLPGPIFTPPPPSSPRTDQTIVFLEPPTATPATAFPEVQLLITRSSDSRFIGRSVRIDKPVFTIGRSDECDLNLADHTWSRNHAEVAYVNDGFIIRDRESRNGVYVNGSRLREGALPFDAVITIGETDLTFCHVRSTTLPDLTGCDVAERYRLVELLRDSARSSTYAAKDMRTSGDVALKLLSPALLEYPAYRDTFKRYAQIAVQLRHPHICGVIDYGLATLQAPSAPAIRTQFLCFELMGGGNLAARLEGAEKIPPTRVDQWLVPIADALDFAHRRGVLHGDLKPSAIVFDQDDHPYITDFSIAQQTLNEGRPVTGTPAYMAPEVWDDGAITPASEEFALASIIYYLVTGSKAFEGQEQPDVRRRNFRRGPIPAHEEAAHNDRTDVPRAVSQVLAKALATNPADRFESATVFALAFRAALRHVVAGVEGPEVFISYQREVSAPLAMYLADRLRAQGIRPFVDTHLLDRAGRFPPQLERAIEDADVFVCLLAGSTLESAYVLEEIRAAHRYDKPMIPIMQESYNSLTENTDPAVEALLSFQGLLVLDRRNLHLEHTATDLARLVKSAVAQRDFD
jgi:serine/threonine protein kinase